MERCQDFRRAEVLSQKCKHAEELREAATGKQIPPASPRSRVGMTKDHASEVIFQSGKKTFCHSEQRSCEESAVPCSAAMPRDNQIPSGRRNNGISEGQFERKGQGSKG